MAKLALPEALQWARLLETTQSRRQLLPGTPRRRSKRTAPARDPGRHSAPRAPESVSDVHPEGALWRAKSEPHLAQRSDLVALQRSLGNKGLRRFVARYIEPGARASQWGNGPAATIQTLPDPTLQRHSIPDNRQGIGEEEDEIQAMRLVQRQPAFGNAAAPPSRTQPWGRGIDVAVQRKNGKGGAAVAPKGPDATKGPPAKGAAAGTKEDEAAKKKAEKEFSEYAGGGPYRINNFVPDTIDDFGKFDAIYDPSAKLLTADMRVKFTFPDLPVPTPKGLGDMMDVMKVIAIQAAYISNFVTQAQAGWSGKFKFKNVREPQSVWGKLNPIQVKVNVTPVLTNQHYTMKAWLKKAGTANVRSNSAKKNPSQVEFFKGDLDPSTQPNTGIKQIGLDEVARLQRNLPKIHFATSSTAVDPKYIPDLKYVADYLRQMNRPKFHIGVVGHASKTGPEPDNIKYSQARAQAVVDKLTAFGVSNHPLAASGVGSTGATSSGSWRKVDFTIKLDPGFNNVQDTTLHEFGHMLGLDDEYVRKGDTRTNTTQLAEMRKMLGNPDYGKGNENKLADERTKVDPLTSASVMERGNEVRSYHYVTLWQALYNTAAKAAKQPVPPMTWNDWKVVG